MKKLSSSLGVLVLILVLLATSAAQVGAAPPDGTPAGNSLADLQQAAGGALDITWNDQTGIPDFIVGQIPTANLAPAAADSTARAMAFLRAYSSVFKLQNPDNELSLIRNTADDLGMNHVRLQQKYQGVPVYGAQLIVHLKGQTVTAVNGEYQPGISISANPSLPSSQAESIAQKELTTPKPKPVPQKDPAKGVDTTPAAEPYAEKAEVMPGKTELLVYPGPDGYHLVWSVHLAAQNPFGTWDYFVDAQSGKVVYKFSTLEDGKNRRTYNLHNTWDWPGTLVYTESGPLPGADGAAQAAHNNIGLVWDYYWSTFHRDSYDGAGHVLDSNVHLGVDYNNAFWSSDYQAMFYGDGDGVVFSSLPYGLDVVAHEMTHAVTEKEAGLVYHNQSGALNESISDVFAVMVDRDDWLIGDTVYLQYPYFLRSLSNPAAGDQPAHVNDFEVSSDTSGGDWGGVHTNSGITNKAAYNVAVAIGRAKTEQIWYRALTVYLTPYSDFNGARNAALAAASDLYGLNGTEWKAVDSGFTAVGLSKVVAQSPHPYANSYTNTWTVTNPDPLATYTRVHFSALSTEDYYDFVDILDGSNNLIETKTGEWTSYTSPNVPGRVVKIRLRTDGSVNQWGFTVDKVYSVARTATTFNVSLPVILDNAYGGWNTGVNIRNASGSPGWVWVVYYDADGNLVGSDSSAVYANGYWGVYNGGKFGGSWAGSAVVQSNLPIKVVVNETGPGGSSMGYSGATSTSTALYFPVVMDNAYGGWTTGMNFRNASSGASTLTVRYYRNNGTVAKVETATIPAYGYWATYQGGKLGSGFAGSALVTSTGPVVAVVNEVHSSGPSISYNGFSAGATTVNLPVMLNNAYGGWTTGVNIMNTSAGGATGTIAYYNSNGTLRTTQSISIPARGYTSFYQGSAGLPNGWAGSAVITVNQPVVAVVNESKSSGDAMGYSGVAPGAAVVNLPVVMDNSYGGWNTGVNIQNTSGSSATVNVYYYATNGSSLGSQSTVVPARGYWSLYQGGALGGHAGSAVVASSQPVAVTVNEIGPGGAAISYNGMP